MVDQRSAEASDYHRWYGTARWQKRRKRQLTEHPLCEMCLALDPPVITPATVADHRIAHKGNPDLFWHGDLASLCAPHHDSTKQSEERGGQPAPIIGADGWPVGFVTPGG